jgi:ABC-type transport system involved in cytochrome c biogenesis permease subunit
VGSSHDWLLVLAWLGIVFYLVILATQERITLGLFLLPVIIGLVVMSTFVDSEAVEEARRLARRRWGMLHAATLVIGIGCVSAATICALMYLLQHQKLRGRSSWVHRLQLPNLEKLTSVNRWLVIGTVAMLTVGLATGYIVAATAAKDEFNWSDPIIAGTTIVWAIMTLTLGWLLTQKEQTGRQVARMTLLAGGFLLLTIFGLMLLSGGVHGDGGRKAESAGEVRNSAFGKSRPSLSFINPPSGGAHS